MRINKEFEITTDKDSNFILIQTYKTKVGTFKTKERYYPTLEAALDGCLKQGLLKTEISKLDTIIKELHKIQKDIKKCLKEDK